MDELAAAVEQVWLSMRELLGSLSAEDWRKPTPCEDWTVHELVSHVAAGNSSIAGFEQPAPPEGFTPTHEGINAFGDFAVAARQSWSADQLLDELVRATDSQLERFRSMDAADWDEASAGPPGVSNLRQLVYVALLDSFIHVLDLRAAMGMPLAPETMPLALGLCLARAIELTPWGAVKRGFLPDGFRARLDLTGAHGIKRDLVIETGRGRFVDPDPATPDSVTGTTLAYFFVVTGRAEWAPVAGGIEADGEMASQLLDRFVIWADASPQRDKVAKLPVRL
jgi:uncharacterized protein (TIGR03083 family)